MENPTEVKPIIIEDPCSRVNVDNISFDDDSGNGCFVASGNTQVSSWTWDWDSTDEVEKPKGPAAFPVPKISSIN